MSDFLEFYWHAKYLYCSTPKKYLEIKIFLGEWKNVLHVRHYGRRIESQDLFYSVRQELGSGSDLPGRSDHYRTSRKKTYSAPASNGIVPHKIDQHVVQSGTQVTFTGSERTLKFDILRTIGVGGLSDIYLGQANDGSKVAIKLSTGSEDVLALRKEAYRMSIVKGDPGFPQLYAHGILEPLTSGETVSAMLAIEYFPRGDANAYIGAMREQLGSGAYNELSDLSGKEWLPWRHPLQISQRARKQWHSNMIDVGQDAFAKLGRLNDDYMLLHRDIKPENIFLDKDGMFIIGDLGDGHTITPEYFSERLIVGGDPSAADDCFAMLLTLLLREGILTPDMVEERSTLSFGNGSELKLRDVYQAHSLNLSTIMLEAIVGWDVRFRSKVLLKAATADPGYKIWLDIWDLLKTPKFNALRFVAPPSPHKEIMKLLRASSIAF